MAHRKAPDKNKATTPPWRNLRPCPWCESRIEPDWKQPELLARQLTKRAGIKSWKKTGACDRHQRRLAKAIRLAREMALLPYMRPRSLEKR